MNYKVVEVLTSMGKDPGMKSLCFSMGQGVLTFSAHPEGGCMKQLRPVPVAGVTAGTVWLNEHKGSESLNYSEHCCPAEQGRDSMVGEKLNTGMSDLK